MTLEKLIEMNFDSAKARGVIEDVSKRAEK